MASSRDSHESEVPNGTNDPPAPMRRSSRRKRTLPTPDKHMVDEAFRSMIEDDGKEIVEMDADGNCLFRSLSDQLYGDFGSEHEQIREGVCDFMEKNKSDFDQFIVRDENNSQAGDFATYLAKMRQDSEWGGHLELRAAAQLYKRKIAIYAASQKPLTIDHDCTKTHGEDILLSRHYCSHYNSVRETSSKRGKPMMPPGSQGDDSNTLGEAESSKSSQPTINKIIPVANDKEDESDSNATEDHSTLPLGPSAAFALDLCSDSDPKTVPPP